MFLQCLKNWTLDRCEHVVTAGAGQEAQGKEEYWTFLNEDSKEPGCLEYLTRYIFYLYIYKFVPALLTLYRNTTSRQASLLGFKL